MAIFVRSWLLVLLVSSAVTALAPPSMRTTSLHMIGTGFSFDDGEQILVSAQKPLGMLLEESDDDTATVYVVELDPNGSASRAGVRVGDVLVAVQNADVTEYDLETTMDWIGRAPRVVNLRFIRGAG